MTAHVQIATTIHKYHPDIGLTRRRFSNNRSKHILMSPGFKHEHTSNIIPIFGKPGLFLFHVPA